MYRIKNIFIRSIDAVKRSVSNLNEWAMSKLVVGSTLASASAVSMADTTITLPQPIIDMYTTITGYVNGIFSLALPAIALSVGLGILVTLSKRFAKKI